MRAEHIVIVLLPLLAVSAAGAGETSPAYEVFALPLEHPDDGPRSVVFDPADPVASPFGWHDVDGAPGPEFFIPRGNNVHAFGDRDGDDLPDPGSEPMSPTLEVTGALVPLDLTLDPAAYLPASVVNLFYWTNVFHDVFHLYGFDEAAGNFQVNNYGAGGAGGDAVRAEAQDGADLGAVLGSIFTTPPDAGVPRMLSRVWNLTEPHPDGVLESMLMAHLLGHGVTARLTGGRLNVSCLANEESMTEGWSDWFGLVLTASPADGPATPRGIGTYVLGQPPDGGGFRPAPYTTDLEVNGFTYDDVAAADTFTIGFVWASMLWDATWNLIADHGFNPDVYDPWTSGGNNLALQLVVDALKLQPCNPGFVDARDAVLLADEILTGGLNRCALWRAFARRGLGVSASQGSPNSDSDGVEAFDLPAVCAGLIFADGFESGDTSAWSAAAP